MDETSGADRRQAGVVDDRDHAQLAAELYDLQWWENDNCHVHMSWKLG